MRYQQLELQSGQCCTLLSSAPAAFMQPPCVPSPKYSSSSAPQLQDGFRRSASTVQLTENVADFSSGCHENTKVYVPVVGGHLQTATGCERFCCDQQEEVQRNNGSATAEISQGRRTLHSDAAFLPNEAGGFLPIELNVSGYGEKAHRTVLRAADSLEGVALPSVCQTLPSDANAFSLSCPPKDYFFPSSNHAVATETDSGVPWLFSSQVESAPSFSSADKASVAFDPGCHCSIVPAAHLRRTPFKKIALGIPPSRATETTFAGASGWADPAFSASLSNDSTTTSIVSESRRKRNRTRIADAYGTHQVCIETKGVEETRESIPVNADADRSPLEEELREECAVKRRRSTAELEGIALHQHPQSCHSTPGWSLEPHRDTTEDRPQDVGPSEMQRLDFHRQVLPLISDSAEVWQSAGDDWAQEDVDQENYDWHEASGGKNSWFGPSAMHNGPESSLEKEEIAALLGHQQRHSQNFQQQETTSIATPPESHATAASTTSASSRWEACRSSISTTGSFAEQSDESLIASDKKGGKSKVDAETQTEGSLVVQRSQHSTYTKEGECDWHCEKKPTSRKLWWRVLFVGDDSGYFSCCMRQRATAREHFSRDASAFPLQKGCCSVEASSSYTYFLKEPDRNSAKRTARIESVSFSERTASEKQAEWLTDYDKGDSLDEGVSVKPFLGLPVRVAWEVPIIKPLQEERRHELVLSVEVSSGAAMTPSDFYCQEVTFDTSIKNELKGGLTCGAAEDATLGAAASGCTNVVTEAEELVPGAAPVGCCFSGDDSSSGIIVAATGAIHATADDESFARSAAPPYYHFNRSLETAPLADLTALVQESNPVGPPFEDFEAQESLFYYTPQHGSTTEGTEGRKEELATRAPRGYARKVLPSTGRHNARQKKEKGVQRCSELDLQYFVTERGVILAANNWAESPSEYKLYGSVTKIYWLDGKVKRIVTQGCLIPCQRSNILYRGADERKALQTAKDVELECASCKERKNADQFPIEGKLRKVRCRNCKTQGNYSGSQTTSGRYSYRVGVDQQKVFRREPWRFSGGIAYNELC